MNGWLACMLLTPEKVATTDIEECTCLLSATVSGQCHAVIQQTFHPVDLQHDSSMFTYLRCLAKCIAENLQHAVVKLLSREQSHQRHAGPHRKQAATPTPLLAAATSHQLFCCLLFSSVTSEHLNDADQLHARLHTSQTISNSCQAGLQLDCNRGNDSAALIKQSHKQGIQHNSQALPQTCVTCFFTQIEKTAVQSWSTPKHTMGGQLRSACKVSRFADITLLGSAGQTAKCSQPR